MNNDNLDQKKEDTQENKNIESQQFFPGGFPLPPQFPRMDDQPRTAPPNFIPEAPSMDRRQMAGPSGYGLGYRDEWQVRPRDLRGCLYRFTYIWLYNGNDFWFFPTYVSRQFVQGFRWRRNRWEYDRINIRRIFYFRCF